MVDDTDSGHGPSSSVVMTLIKMTIKVSYGGCIII